jgi:hypothetical protein
MRRFRPRPEACRGVSGFLGIHPGLQHDPDTEVPDTEVPDTEVPDTEVNVRQAIFRG